MTEIEQDTAVRMTKKEIALMRRIIAWRKANGVEFVRSRTIGTYWIDTFGAVGPKRRSVAYEREAEGSLGTCAGRYASYEWQKAESFTQAVDVLVAYGYLPAVFSSAYRAGYDAGGANYWADINGRPDPAAYASRLPAVGE